MANEITNTESDVRIPELWRPAMLVARYAKMVIGQRVLSVDGDVSAKGDQLHISIEPTVSVNDVGSNGSVTNQALTPTEAVLLVNKWKETTIDVVDKAQRQALGDLLTDYLPAFGKASGAQFDSDLAGLHGDITSNAVGETDVAKTLDTVNESLALAAIQKLLDLDIPLEDPNNISFCFHTSVWSQLKGVTGFTYANLTGSSMGGTLTMKIPDLYGIPTYFSTKIVSSAGVRKNLLFYREAFAWGMQKNFRVEVLSRVRKSTPISADYLYGVKTVRQNHACLINTKA